MPDHFFVRLNGRYQKVRFVDIQYIESFKNYVRITTAGKAFVVLLSLKQIETVLPPQDFCRVHRSFIVSLAQVTAFDHELVYLEGKEIPLSPQYTEQLHARVMILTATIRTGPIPAEFAIGNALSATA